MGAGRILQFCDGKLGPIYSQPIFSTTTVPWPGFVIEEGKTPGPQTRWIAERPTIFVCDQGQGIAGWLLMGESEKYHCVPGSICTTSPEYEFRHTNFSNEWHTLALALDISKFSYHAPAESKAIKFLKWGFAEDRTIASLIKAMHREAKDGNRSGRLYVESLSLALLAYLAARYTSRVIEDDITQLSPLHKMKVLQLIRESVGTDLTVSDLAAVVEVNTSRFYRLFKSSFGISPYNFIMNERVAKAKELLLQNKWSVAYIAAELGFCNHSHFTKVFHRLVGVTPTDFRKGG